MFPETAKEFKDLFNEGGSPVVLAVVFVSQWKEKNCGKLAPVFGDGKSENMFGSEYASDWENQFPSLHFCFSAILLRDPIQPDKQEGGRDRSHAGSVRKMTLASSFFFSLARVYRV
jgi:hypothetical protein